MSRVRALASGYTVLVLLFLLAPAAIAIPASFSNGTTLEFPPDGFSLRWYGAFFDDATWTGAVVKSLQIALGSTAISLTLGFLAAFGLYRFRLRARGLVWALLMLPLLVPLVVVGTGLFLIVLDLGLLGQTWTATVAHAALALPIVVLVLSAALAGLERDMLESAESLGASRWMVMREVVLPNVAPSLVVAAILAFIVSWDEVVVTSFLLTASGDTTLPVKMFSYVRDAVNPTPAAISTMLLGVTALALGLTYALQRSLTVGNGRSALADRGPEAER